MKDFKLIVPDNSIKLGTKVDEELQKKYYGEGKKESFLVRPNLIRFNNGEGKCLLEESIRGQVAYILSDVSNYSITYKCQVGVNHNMMPDEHFQDIKRIINSTCGNAKKIVVIVPYFYQSRQDKRNGRESLDLAMALGELKHYGVSEVITADIHNKSAADNASPSLPINNFYCSDDFLLKLIVDEKIDFNNVMVVSPDFGAMPRANFYASMLGGVPLGVFHKQRDYQSIQDGKNPIVEHKLLYDGDITGKDVIVVDDMIASGGSIIDTAKKLREKGAGRIFLLATFGLFTKGGEVFADAYLKKYFDKVYVTNLNYVPDEILKENWLSEVDCSSKIASIIYNMNEDKSIGDLLNGKEQTKQKIKVLRDKSLRNR